MDYEAELRRRGFTGGWVARDDLPPMTNAQAIVEAQRSIPWFEKQVVEAERDLGADHMMTVHYRQALADLRRLAADG